MLLHQLHFILLNYTIVNIQQISTEAHSVHTETVKNKNIATTLVRFLVVHGFFFT